jgi:hypothetical protein
MSRTVCLLARTLNAPTAGGNTWVYLNWALGLQALGCRVVWLEAVSSASPVDRVQARLCDLKRRLAPFGLQASVALCSAGGEPLRAGMRLDAVDLDTAAEADLFLDMAYAPAELVARFRRSALFDIDPGLCQLWVSRGQIPLPRHDFYFTIGETVGRPDARFPDCGVAWRHVPPCVFLDRWPVTPRENGAPFTTVSNWIMCDYWVDDDSGGYANDKRTGFFPFLDVPALTDVPLELALSLGGATEERDALQRRGWQVQEAHEIAASPGDYQRYIQRSAGEFSCAKPSCVRLQNAWVSDRTLCYLASGKPAVVQHTGPSRLLPDAAGLFRFSTPAEAVGHLEAVADDYSRQCELARALAEEHFDARQVVGRLLEQTLG